MTLSTGIGSLKASVRRLEALAGKGARCGLCRIGTRLLAAGSERESGRAESAVRVKCEFCHSEFLRSLKGIPEGDREFYRLTYPFTMEDEFTDPRAHAAALWQAYRPWPEEEEVAGATRQQRGAERKAKMDPRVRTLNALRAKYQEARERRRKRLVARYGADLFPEQRRLVEAIWKSARAAHTEEVYVSGLPELRTAATRYLVCAELEKIIVGRTLLSTEEFLARLKAQITEMVEGARRDKERKEEDRHQREEELRGRSWLGECARFDDPPPAESPSPGLPVGEDGGLPWNEDELKSISSAVIVRAARTQQTAVARALASRPFLSPSKESGCGCAKGRD